MPTRILREGILTSQRINALSTEAELFYRRLMSVVDDFGRFDADEKLLISRCYPLTFDRILPTDVSKWLTELCKPEDNPLLVVYACGPKWFLQINDFGQRERSASKFPPPSVSSSPSFDRTLPQNSASRARSPTTTTTTTTTDEAAECGEPWDWFCSEFKGEVEADAWKEFMGHVTSPELLATMQANLPLWMKTSKYESGHGKGARWFIRDGLWRNPPNSALMGKKSKREEFWDQV